MYKKFLWEIGFVFIILTIIDVILFIAGLRVPPSINPIAITVWIAFNLAATIIVIIGWAIIDKIIFKAARMF